MIERIYYINNSIELEEAIDFLQALLPCFVERELVEMDYSKVTITARCEDVRTVDLKLAPLI